MGCEGDCGSNREPSRQKNWNSGKTIHFENQNQAAFNEKQCTAKNCLPKIKARADKESKKSKGNALNLTKPQGKRAELKSFPINNIFKELEFKLKKPFLFPLRVLNWLKKIIKE